MLFGVTLPQCPHHCLRASSTGVQDDQSDPVGGCCSRVEYQRHRVLTCVCGGFEDHDALFREQRRAQEFGQLWDARIPRAQPRDRKIVAGAAPARTSAMIFVTARSTRSSSSPRTRCRGVSLTDRSCHVSPTRRPVPRTRPAPPRRLRAGRYAVSGNPRRSIPRRSPDADARTCCRVPR